MRRPFLCLLPALTLLSLATTGCGTADPAGPLAPTTSTPTASHWGGTWHAVIGSDQLTLFVGSQRRDGEWFSVWYALSGSGLISYPEPGRGPVPLLLRGSYGVASGMSLDILDGRFPASLPPGTAFTPRVIATFRSSTVSDTLLRGTLTLTPDDSTGGHPLLAEGGEVTFRR